MSDRTSDTWDPAVGDQRRVTVEVGPDGTPTIVEPQPTNTIDLKTEFDHPTGTELTGKVEIVDKAGLTSFVGKIVDADLPTQSGPTRQELLDELRRLAADIGDTTVTLDDVDTHGTYDRDQYQAEFESFVCALEEAKLEPTELQYRFSNKEVPEEMQGTQNVSYLRENGPATSDELPGGIGQQDKMHGVAGFAINKNVLRPDRVYYLMDEHDPEAVVQKFYEENPEVVENSSQRTLTSLASDHGREFRAPARALAKQFEGDDDV